MDPFSIHAGGMIVTIATWFFIALVVTKRDGVVWESYDYKAFIAGVICCILWFVTLPLMAIFYYKKLTDS